MVHSRYGHPVSIGCVLVFLLAAWPATAAHGGNLMLADFEGERVESVRGLALPVVADEQFGGTSTARLTLIHPGAQASHGALRISFVIADGVARPFSSVSVLMGDESLATDLSAYRGLRFYARSGRGNFLASVGRFTGRFVRYMAPFPVKPEWTLVELPFDKFTPVPPAAKDAALVPADVVSVGFSVASDLRGQLDLEIDQVEVYK